MPKPIVACVGNAVIDALVGPGVAHPSKAEVDAMKADGSLGRTLSARYDAEATWMPGGSAANTAAELGRLGIPTTFVGLAGDDAPGRRVAASLEAAGVRALVGPAGGGHATSRIYVFIDGDGERSFAPALDACDGLSEAHVMALRGEALSAVHVEAYLLDRPSTSGAFHAALSLAEAAGAIPSVTLGTPGVAGRHAREILGQVHEGRIDLLIGNEEEFTALFTDEVALEQAMLALPCTCVMTRGPRGALATRCGQGVEASAQPVDRVVDTTGAGDAFAAGFLSVHAADGPLGEALRVAARCGAEAVGRVGARVVATP